MIEQPVSKGETKRYYRYRKSEIYLDKAKDSMPPIS